MNRRSANFLTFNLLLWIILIIPQIALTQGIIVPSEIGHAYSNGTPILISHKVNVVIQKSTAEVTVEQDFFNSGKMPVEGYFYFPLPEGASFEHLKVQPDREEPSITVLTSKESWVELEALLQKYLDPALLQYSYENLIKCKLNPMDSKKHRKIILTYRQSLSEENGLYKFNYALKKHWLMNPDFRPRSSQKRFVEMQVSIQTDEPVKILYSPTHHLDIEYRDQHLVKIGVTSELNESGNFVLFFSSANQPLDACMLTYKSGSQNEGFFMLLMSPDHDVPLYKLNNKDVVFVLDLSKSMRGKKIQQVKNAIKYAIRKLNRGDRFNIVAFNNSVKVFKYELVPAKIYEKEAINFVNRLKTVRGANLHEALLAALSVRNPKHRLRYLVLITDGYPTVGVTELREIQKDIRRLNRSKFKIMAFGIGQKVNVELLNKIATDSKGHFYVIENNQIEPALINFFDHLNSVVFSSIKFDFRNIKTFDRYPDEVASVSLNSNKLVLGRYRFQGKSRLQITANFHKSRRHYSYDLAFPDENKNHYFIVRLWALRKMGYLLNNLINEKNDQKEIYEIVHLAKSYGLTLPILSYLLQKPIKPASNIFNQEALLTYMNRLDNLLISNLSEIKNKGSQNLQLGKLASRLKNMNQFRPLIVGLGTQLEDKIFWRGENGYWMDLDCFASENEGIIHIKYGSEVYFKILRMYPVMRKYLALGNQVVFRAGRRIIVVDNHGVEAISQAELISLMTR